jgi:ABC-type glutathione transport system ATPase component
MREVYPALERQCGLFRSGCSGARSRRWKNDMIQIRNLGTSYKTTAGFHCVLRQIQLDVNEGDFVTFMGPSGAGKSTLPSIS